MLCNRDIVTIHHIVILRALTHNNGRKKTTPMQRTQAPKITTFLHKYTINDHPFVLPLHFMLYSSLSLSSLLHTVISGSIAFMGQSCIVQKPLMRFEG